MSIQSFTPQALSQADEVRATRREGLVRRLNRNNAIASSLLWLITAIVAIIFVAIIINIVWTGLPAVFSSTFYSTGGAGIVSELFNSFYILILTEIFLVPISLAAAICLVEYTRQGPFVTVIHFAAETLAGVPSLVLGMFGFLLFSISLHMGVSRLSGALTLLCLNFPLALRLFEGSLANVPREQREGALALGSTKWHSIWTVVLPSALPGIITGVILTAGKIIGEAAALLFTMGTTNPNNVFTLSPMIASDTLTTRLYYLKQQGIGTSGLNATGEAALDAGLAAALILLLLIINLVARIVGRRIQRRLTAA
ncbi:MAG TPA: ABC transporter permease subunit [Ktedonobacteraceae bacterium]|jgi:phosphate transport system permease protein